MRSSIYILIAIVVVIGILFFLPKSDQSATNGLGTFPEVDDILAEPKDEAPEEVLNESGDAEMPEGNGVGMEFPAIDTSEENEGLIACPADARGCPDGSFVGRIPPTCEFEACPTTEGPGKIEPSLPDVLEEDEAPVAHVFNIVGKNFEFSMTELTVKEGDTVTINFSSAEGFHDWVVDEFSAATERTAEGELTSVTFAVNKKGIYEYYCSVGNHRAMGMVGTLIVE